MGYHVAGPDGNLMVLGLREIEAKSAKDTLQTYKEILQDIDNCSKSATNESSMKILLHTIATMSDRAATEVKFNELLRVSQRGFARGSQRLRQHEWGGERLTRQYVQLLLRPSQPCTHS